jgi:hypothetical protein
MICAIIPKIVRTFDLYKNGSLKEFYDCAQTPRGFPRGVGRMHQTTGG